MGTRPNALYSAVMSDLDGYLPLGPVGLSQIPPDASYKQFAATVLSSTLLKKYMPDDTTKADQAAKEKFFTSNKTCGDWSVHFDDEADRILYGEFRRQIDDFLHPGGQMLFDTYFDIIKGARVGPGSAIGARSQSMYAKLFSSPLTATSDFLYRMYKDYVQWFHIWDDAESQRYSQYGNPTIVNCSRCSFVPKTVDISRMICVEPNLNMFFQLGLGTLLEGRLKDHFNCDLSTQPEDNRRLAQSGSAGGSFATIDLSAASDSISVNLCREIFPAWFFETLQELRSPFTMIDGKLVPLNMISTMGNGFTFPLQTVIFSCLIRAAYRVSDVPILDGKLFNWACFGDDLICDTKAYRNVMRLLRMLGFSANPSKSFFEGPFRESCGADWFNGQPVRGVYIKQLRTIHDLFVAINSLNTWTSYTGIPLNKAVQYLLSELPPHLRERYVPFEEGPESGIRVPSTFLEKRHFKFDRNNSVLYRVYRAREQCYVFGDGVVRYPKGGKKLIYNPSGLMMSFLYGEVVAGRISVRHDRVFFHTRLRCTPRWDYMPFGTRSNGHLVSWQQWETAVLINLSNPLRN